MKKYILVTILSLVINVSGLSASATANSLDRQLICITRLGSKEAVERLLENGANVNTLNGYWTALMWAASKRFKDIVELLLDKGADINATSCDGWTALMSTANVGAEDMVRLLLERGADVNAAGKYGMTALMRAAHSGSKEIVELLLEAGANANAVDNNRKTAIDIASNSKIKEFLRRYKAFKFLKIDKSFDKEPEIKDYENREMSHDNDLQYELDRDERAIKAFHEDHFAYWHDQVQKAYKLFIFQKDSAPLRSFLIQELSERSGLLRVFMRSFHSREDFLCVLHELKNGATEQELERLQEVSIAEKSIEKEFVKIEEDMSKRYREIDLSRIREKIAVRKIEEAFKKHKSLQSNKQQNLSIDNIQKK